MNKAVSLILVASALAFRGLAIPFDTVLSTWPIAINLLCGSLLGSWLGADIATRLTAATLYRVIAVLLVAVALVLLLFHEPVIANGPALSGAALIVAGVLAGAVIGAIASLLGVAGGEFLISTLVLLFGVDIKVAGSLSLAISFPTMLVGFARYSRDQSFAVLGRNRPFLIAMVAGSIAGALVV